MRNLTRFIRGLAASMLLAAGLHAAAAKLDPITHQLGESPPENAKSDQAKTFNPPCVGGGPD